MNIIEVKDFSFSYPDQRKEALVHASMEIKEGTLNVICGRSGCGKSTLLRQLKSVLAPHGASTGSILFKGTPLNKVDHRTQSSEIGYVMQNPDNQIVTDKVWHELAFGLESLGFETEDIRLRVAEMASYFGIHQWFYKGVEELSGGQKQRVAIASAIASDKQVIVFDEPTSGLDYRHMKKVAENLRELSSLGKTLFIVTHDPELIAECCNYFVFIENGKVLWSDGWNRISRERLQKFFAFEDD